MSRIFHNPQYHNSADPKANVMDSWERQGKTYRYVKVVDLDVAAGDVVLYTATEGNVTKDYTGGTAHIGLCAGAALGAITAGQYGIIQTKGYCPTVNVHEDTAAGDVIAAPNATDGRGSIWTPTTTAATLAQLKDGAKRLGFACAADTANYAPCILDCP